MRTRAIDLAQLYIFYRNRGWNTLDQKSYDAIMGCDIDLNSYSIQKKELLKALTQDIEQIGNNKNRKYRLK